MPFLIGYMYFLINKIPCFLFSGGNANLNHKLADIAKGEELIHMIFFTRWKNFVINMVNLN
jgi:hypothetical protein